MEVSMNRSIHADAVHIENHKKKEIFVENNKGLGWEDEARVPSSACGGVSN